MEKTRGKAIRNHINSSCWVEKKVDILVDLDVTSRFHSVTIVFDGATSSTTNVQEVEPKDWLENKAKFDDVTDVSVNGPNVEEPEKDPKLEEE
ncbi:Hypothetical predicted protein, partial [Olea europaea subsp. europaea]